MKKNETMSVIKRVLNTKDAAAYLGIVSARTLEKWRRASESKGPKWVDIEGRIGYRIDDLDAYLRERARTPGDDFAA